MSFINVNNNNRRSPKIEEFLSKWPMKLQVIGIVIFSIITIILIISYYVNKFINFSTMFFFI